MTRVRYTGAHTATLMDYIDLETGRALAAVPGRVYDVTPASGRAVPDVPGNCVALGDTDWRPIRLKPAADPDEVEAAETAAEDGSEEEDEPGGPAE